MAPASAIPSERPATSVPRSRARRCGAPGRPRRRRSPRREERPVRSRPGPRTAQGSRTLRSRNAGRPGVRRRGRARRQSRWCRVEAPRPSRVRRRCRLRRTRRRSSCRRSAPDSVLRAASSPSAAKLASLSTRSGRPCTELGTNTSCQPRFGATRTRWPWTRPATASAAPTADRPSVDNARCAPSASVAMRINASAAGTPRWSAGAMTS